MLIIFFFSILVKLENYNFYPQKKATHIYWFDRNGSRSMNYMNSRCFYNKHCFIESVIHLIEKGHTVIERTQ